MDEKELEVWYRDMSGRAGELLTCLAKVVGKEPPGILRMFVYEANRRLEEFMHRVNDCMVVLSQKTPANIDAVIEKALKDGTVKAQAGEIVHAETEFKKDA